MEKFSNCLYSAVCTSNCTSSCIRYLEMQALIEQSGLTENQCKSKQLWAEDEDIEAFELLALTKDNIQEFVKSGRSLYICSEHSGNGKTSWAIRLLLKYFDCIWAGNGFKPRGLFIHTPTFLCKCKNFSAKNDKFEQFKSYVLEADLVIWDDIATSGVSNFDFSQLLMYIDARCAAGKANIYTSNITNVEELAKILGPKLSSRIAGYSTDIVEFKEGDKR